MPAEFARRHGKIGEMFMRDTVLVTGSAGLIGSETARFFHDKGFRIVGIDNDMRKSFFGAGAFDRLESIAAGGAARGIPAPCRRYP